MFERFKIAGIGEVLWDVFPDGEEFGGAPANFIAHSGALGAEAYVVSCVGQDYRGQKARDFLEQHSVNTDCLETSGKWPTGTVEVKLDAGGKPSYEIIQPVAWDYITWSDRLEELAGGLDAVCFGSLAQRNEISRKTIQRFLASTGTDCLRVFDINIRQQFYTKELILESLSLANALKLNDEELPLLAMMLEIEGGLESQLKAVMERFGLRLAVLTSGSDGALMMTPTDRDLTVPRDVEVVSTVGAGDSFTAGMVLGYLAGKPLAQINRAANELATYVCTKRGAVPPDLPGLSFDES
jgi:fructokinase